ncbi:TPA: hypothetical protein N0F65_012184 [Lagenidium giganteum]|uniref:D-serine dehydratase n=1 Tax=Lagenidium giganteum TaxID=4803 RepID=A0AAV2ZAY9_9STRA|nr:TPA: hypothetical protein N0F65_012184 [Lagenidium giganteum]
MYQYTINERSVILSFQQTKTRARHHGRSNVTSAMSARKPSGRQIKELFYSEVTPASDSDSTAFFRCRCGKIRAQSLRHGYTNLTQHVVMKHPEWLTSLQHESDVGPVVALANRTDDSPSKTPVASAEDREMRTPERKTTSMDASPSSSVKAEINGLAGEKDSEPETNGDDDAEDEAAPAVAVETIDDEGVTDEAESADAATAVAEAAIAMGETQVKSPVSSPPCAPVVRKREDYLTWDDYFMSVAFLSAMRSKDPSTQVGACIVSPDNKIVGIGYNGFPNGCGDDNLPWARESSTGSALDTKYPYVCHAEMNAILNKNAADVRGCTIYVALFPCNECAKLIIQSGIARVMYCSDKYHNESQEHWEINEALSSTGLCIWAIIPHFAQPKAGDSQSTTATAAIMREWMTTPSVMVNEQRVKHNVQHMQQIATSHGVQLRPHVKTHKSVEIAQLQLEAGAVGITTSKPTEALKFLHSGLKGLKSVLLAYPVVHTNKMTKLLVAAQQFKMELRVTVDSINGLDAVEKAAISCDYPVHVLLHIDVGYHRVGMEEGDPRIAAFAKRIHDSKHLEFTGILSHAGHAYACSNAEECAALAETERQIMLRIKSSIEAIGVPVPVVSVGSTLTELPRKNFEGITEIRPGNYVFLDRTPLRMGLVRVKDLSLTVLVTVVSVNKHNIIVDAGSKVLSSDMPRAGANPTDFGNKCYGLAFLEKDFDLLGDDAEPSQNRVTLANGREIVCFEVSKLSEEHGWLKQVDGVPAPAIGQRMIVIPNHSCVVTNLTDSLYVQGEHSKVWKVLSRGCTQ